jgi:hypothetical protein
MLPLKNRPMLSASNFKAGITFLMSSASNRPRLQRQVAGRCRYPCRRTSSGGPDVVLMDIRLTGDSSRVDAARELHTRQELRCIFLIANLDEPTRTELLPCDPCCRYCGSEPSKRRNVCLSLNQLAGVNRLTSSEQRPRVMAACRNLDCSM